MEEEAEAVSASVSWLTGQLATVAVVEAVSGAEAMIVLGRWLKLWMLDVGE